MEKPWFDFFAPGLVGKSAKPGVKLPTSQPLSWRLVLTGVILSLPIATSSPALDAIQQASPMVSPSPLAESEFLQLPSFDLEWAENPPKTIQVGDRLSLKMSGTAPASSVDPAQMSESLFDQGWDVSSENGVTAIPLKAGALTLPTLPLRDGSGRLIGRTNPFSIQVGSAILPDDPKPQEPAPMRPPVDLAFPWWVLLIASLLLGLLLAAFFYAFYRWRKRGRVAPPKPLDPPKPEDVVALAALTELEKRNLMKGGQYKAHYFGVSEIIKTYVGSRYRFDAIESTTTEILRFLESRESLGDSTLDRIESLLSRLDFVKFTDHVPNGGDGIQVLEDARHLVLTTRRAPPTTPILPGGA
ncbi:MAG: hypothetical protein A2428_06550 [Bdellovibrionales bacterium RIFOXYC1_FULL_54_43]|nr:MAG: hypothetical protein A2428_06550 [Bdellovibrionales bacterium RIFOXYC1_FULL_54_43]OFZ85110.1 MAG: hypothetical protein A2603_07195 [Bdellovibrionales bacterium RIFOXYD1_FULL_55_31]